MKHYIKFDLPEDIMELKAAMAGTDLALILLDLDEWLRGQIKYNDKNEYQPVRDELNQLLGERNIILHDLVC